MRESSKRPSMAFVFFTRAGEALPADELVPAPAAFRADEEADAHLRRLARAEVAPPTTSDAWARLQALATLKFNPSVGQILRADLFGGVVGGAVLLISALLLGPTVGFTRPVPYILAGIGAIGAKTLVSFLWADAAENPGTTADGSPSGKRYRNVWW